MSDQAQEPTEQETDQSNVQDGFDSFLQGITDKSGRQKFSTPDDLKRGYEAGQEFIEQLKNENAELRDAVSKAKGAEDLVQEFLRKQQDQQTVDQQQEQAPVDMSKAVREQLEQIQREQVVSQNAAKVAERIKEAIPDATEREQFLSRKAAELNIGLETLQGIAAESPDAFFELVGVKAQSEPTRALPGQNQADMYGTPKGPADRQKISTSVYTTNEAIEKIKQYSQLSAEDHAQIRANFMKGR